MFFVFYRDLSLFGLRFFYVRWIGLRNGYTTGASAAAAAQAAVVKLFTAERLSQVELILPRGEKAVLPIEDCFLDKECALAAVVKDGGDDPDMTHGLLIWAKVRQDDSLPCSVVISGGTGVGRVTKPGLQVPVGEAAINPVPRRMIKEAVEKVLPEGKKVEVTVFVPKGEEIARQTFNPRLGIVGGISILGTTGIVKPMSEEAFKASLALQLSMAQAKGVEEILLTPGNIGEKIAKEKMVLPPEAIVQMSNFVGFMLHECVRYGMKRVLLMGHHGKLVKVAGGIFHTHSHVADAKREIMTAHAALLGAPHELLVKMMQANTAEEILVFLEEYDFLPVFNSLAEEVSRQAALHVHGKLETGCVLISLSGKILGMDEAGRDWLRRNAK